jgi:hypothetical protein
MIQDIITYMVILWAVSYAAWTTVRVFIPEGEAVKKSPCSSCAGCDFIKDCS